MLGDEISGNLTSYTWNNSTGILSSTTGNVTGIYDLVGGIWEYVAGYIPIQDNTSYINNSGGAFSKTNNDIIKTVNTEYVSVYDFSGTGIDRELNYEDIITIIA